MIKIFDFLYEDNFREKVNNKRIFKFLRDFISVPFFSLMLFLLPYYAKEFGEENFNQFIIFLQLFLFSFCLKLFFAKEIDYKEDLKEELVSAIITIFGLIILSKLKFAGIYDEADASFQGIFLTIGYLIAFTVLVYFICKKEEKRVRILLFAAMLGCLLSILFLYYVNQNEIMIPINIFIAVINVLVIYFFDCKSYAHFFNKSGNS